MHVRHRPRPGSILATPGRRQRHGLTTALLAGGALLVGLSAPLTARAADVDCLTVADGGNLLTIVDRTDTSPATNEVTIGALGVPDVEAIAYRSATGVLYGADAEQLGIIDQTTALFVALPAAFGSGGGALGALTFSDVDGLAFDPFSGTLYGAHRRGGPDVLIVIDPLSGVRVADAFGAGTDYVVIDPIAGLGDIDDIAIDPIDGQLYGVANNGGSGDRLVRIDKATGDTTDVGLIGVADVEGLTIDPAGGLWGATGTGGTASTRNSLYPLDKSTGVAGTRVPLDNGTDYEAVACNLHGRNTLSGMVFLDGDGDGIRDPGESSGTAGVTVRLYRDSDGNGAIDPGEPVLAIVVTGAGGTYAFSFAATGDFAVDIDSSGLPAGHVRTSSGPQATAFGSLFGQSDPDNDFGHVLPAGPAPAPTPTIPLPDTDAIPGPPTGPSAPADRSALVAILALLAGAGASLGHVRRERRGRGLAD